MSRKNRQLVAHEPIEFEKQPVEVGDFMRITDHFIRIFEIVLKSTKPKTGRCQHVTSWV
jgi:hypothetical protein